MRHSEPYPGDNGIRFEVMPEWREFFEECLDFLRFKEERFRKEQAGKLP
jgi:hypothetical protein